MAEEPPESLGCTIGIAVGLAVIGLGLAGLVGFSFLALGAEIDGPAYAADVFRAGEPPFGLEVAEATRFRTGEVIVRLERVDEAPPPEGAPEEIVLVEMPGREAARALFLTGARPDNPFQQGGDDSAGREASAQLAEWERDPAFAWHTTVDAEELVWSRWRTDFRIERSFREDGTWRDSARLDLCQDGRYLILFAQWPADTEATRAGLEEVVRTVRMLAPEDGTRVSATRG